MTQTAHELFLEHFYKTEVIPFKHEQNNSTGYYEGVTSDEDLNIQRGQVVASRSPEPNNRKLLIKGLGKGAQMVIFERYTNGQHGILVQNKPSTREIRFLNIEVPDIGDSALKVENVEAFINFK